MPVESVEDEVVVVLMGDGFHVVKEVVGVVALGSDHQLRDGLHIAAIISQLARLLDSDHLVQMSTRGPVERGTPHSDVFRVLAFQAKRARHHNVRRHEEPGAEQLDRIFVHNRRDVRQRGVEAQRSVLQEIWKQTPKGVGFTQIA